MSEMLNPLSVLSGQTAMSDDKGKACFGRTNTQIGKMLREAKLRPTRQRVALAKLLYSKGKRHVSAELLHEEALAAKVPVSLATIYNTLHQFTEAGLLLAVVIDSTKTYFDTYVDHHHHFFVEDDNTVFDVPSGEVEFGRLPEIPEGMEISKIDVVVRLRRKNPTN